MENCKILEIEKMDLLKELEKQILAASSQARYDRTKKKDEAMEVNTLTE